MTGVDDNRQKLIAILQLAYSGELAAAYAYRGHWRSVSAAEERESIRTIEEDEWRHRKLPEGRRPSAHRTGKPQTLA